METKLRLEASGSWVFSDSSKWSHLVASYQELEESLQNVIPGFCQAIQVENTADLEIFVSTTSTPAMEMDIDKIS